MATLRERIAVARNAKERSGLRAVISKEAVDALWPVSGPLAVARNGWTIVFDGRPALIRDRQGAVVGVDAMVRVFRNATELHVDPHRICINPPVIHNGEENPVEAYLTWLVESLRDAPNAKGWRTKGTVTTVYGDTADTWIQSSSATYSLARAGTGSLTAVSATNSTFRVGQYLSGGTYICSEAFIKFDTSSIPDTDTISQVDLEMVPNADQSATDFTAQARVYDWGAAVDTGDFTAGASLSALTRVATLSSSGIGTGSYVTFTEDGTNFQSAINATGTTYLVLTSDRMEANTTPAGLEYVDFRSADRAGTTDDPKLTITHAASSVSASGAVATVTVGGLAGAATVNTLASGALATVSVAGYAGTETHGATAAGGLATVSVAGLSGTGTYVVSGSGGLATVTVDGYGGEAGKITADGAVATVDVAGYAGTVTYDVSGAGGLATVDVAGYAGTVAYDVSGASGLATVTVAGLDGTGTYVVSGTGALGTVDVAGYAGETTVAVGGAGDVALVTVAGYAGAASYGVSSEGALAMVTVVGYAGRQLNRFVSGRRPRPGSGRFFGSGPGAGRFSPGRG